MGESVENPLFARVFHRICGRDRGRGERELRRELLAGARGRVVEVGAGNGINFEHYPETVDRLIAVEPEPYLRGRAEQAAAGAPVPVEVRSGVAASLGLEPSSVDALVVSGVLCSVPDQVEALAEFRRVLVPGGELRFWSTSAPGDHGSRAGSAAPTRSGRASSAAATQTATRSARSSTPPSAWSAAAASATRHARAYPVTPRVLGLARAPR